MTHDEAAVRLPELVGLRAAGPGEVALRAHVDDCETCRARLAAMNALDARLRAEGPLEPVSARLERRVLAIPGLAAHEPHRPAARRWAAAAAVAALLMAGALGAEWMTGGSSPAGPAAPRMITLATPGGHGMSVRMEVGAVAEHRIPIRIMATGLPHAAGDYYEVWLTGASGTVSGGAFRPDDGGRCEVAMEIPAGDWSAVAITDGGRPPSPATTLASGAL